MKVKKDNTVKLERGEIRVGNFFFKVEEEHIKVQDLNSLLTFRVSKRMAIGIWLENTIGMKTDESEETLRAYAATVWSFLAMVPDNESVSQVISLVEDAMKRHPDWYGYKPSDDEDANAEAAQEVKEMKEFEEEVKKMSDNGD